MEKKHEGQAPKKKARRPMDGMKIWQQKALQHFYTFRQQLREGGAREVSKHAKGRMFKQFSGSEKRRQRKEKKRRRKQKWCLKCKPY